MSANKSKRWEGINRRGNKLWWNYRDQGRVDLARAALERALARLRKGGAR